MEMEQSEEEVKKWQTIERNMDFFFTRDKIEIIFWFETLSMSEFPSSSTFAELTFTRHTQKMWKKCRFIYIDEEMRYNKCFTTIYFSAKLNYYRIWYICVCVETALTLHCWNMMGTSYNKMCVNFLCLFVCDFRFLSFLLIFFIGFYAPPHSWHTGTHSASLCVAWLCTSKMCIKQLINIVIAPRKFSFSFRRSFRFSFPSSDAHGTHNISMCVCCACLCLHKYRKAPLLNEFWLMENFQLIYYYVYCVYCICIIYLHSTHIVFV